MNLKWDALYVLVNAIVNGEVISKSANGLRIAYGNYGFFIRNDGSNTYFMLTNSGDNMGTYNGLRPLWINNATGAVSMGRGLNVSGRRFQTVLLLIAVMVCGFRCAITTLSLGKI